MLFNPTDLENEIRELHVKILEKRRAFDEGMKNDMPFEQLKAIFVEIKELSKRQELCFEEANVRGSSITTYGGEWNTHHNRAKSYTS